MNPYKDLTFDAFESFRGRRDTGDFDVPRHVTTQIATAEKLYTRGGQKYTFSESSLPALSKKFKMGSIGIPSKILASSFGKICRCWSSLHLKCISFYIFCRNYFQFCL